MPLEDLLRLYAGSLIDPATAVNDTTSLLASSLTPAETFLPVSFGEGFGTYYVDPTLTDLTLYRLEDLNTSPTWSGMPALSQAELFGALNRANLADVGQAGAQGGGQGGGGESAGGSPARSGLASLGLTFANIPPAGDLAVIPEAPAGTIPAVSALPIPNAPAIGEAYRPQRWTIPEVEGRPPQAIPPSERSSRMVPPRPVPPFRPLEAPPTAAPESRDAMPVGLNRLLAPDPFAESKRRIRGVQ